MSEQPTPEHIMQVGLGFWASKTLLSAVEMGLFTELAKHPEDLETIQGRLGLHPRSTRDFLDALVALGFLQRRDGKYHNTPATDLFLDKRKPSYVGGLLEMANHRLYGFWNHLTQALRTGKPQNEAKDGGTPIFEALYADPARLKEFLAAMTGISSAANRLIAANSFPGGTTRRSPTSAPLRGTSPSRSLSPTPTCPASASTSPRWSPSLRSTSSATAWPAAFASSPAISSPTCCPRST